MTGLTAERLDGMPEDTVVGVLWSGGAEERFIAEEDSDGTMVWAGTAGNYEDSESLIRNAVSVRVVSVPIDALLADDAVLEIVGDLMLEDGDPWNVLQGAIAHVTGEAP